MSYRIVRFYQDDRPQQTILTGVSLEVAQQHCNDPATSGKDWFDGYTEEE